MIVVEKGLTPGDRVIVEGLLRARPGMQVAPTLWTADADALTVRHSPHRRHRLR